MDEEQETIRLRPDVFSTVTAVASVVMSAVIALGWTAGAQRALGAGGHLATLGSVVNAVVVPLVIFLGGVITFFLLLRRQVVIIDADGIHHRTGRRDKLVRWADMHQVTLTRVSTGRSAMPAIVIDHGIGRIAVIHESNKISGRTLFQRIDAYVAAHAIPVRTRTDPDKPKV